MMYGKQMHCKYLAHLKILIKGNNFVCHKIMHNKEELQDAVSLHLQNAF